MQIAICYLQTKDNVGFYMHTNDSIWIWLRLNTLNNQHGLAVKTATLDGAFRTLTPNITLPGFCWLFVWSDSILCVVHGCNVPSHPVEVAVQYDGEERCVFTALLCCCLVRCPLQHQAGEKSARDWESRTTDKSFIRGRHPSASHVVRNTETLTAVGRPTIPLFRSEGYE